MYIYVSDYLYIYIYMYYMYTYIIIITIIISNITIIIMMMMIIISIFVYIGSILGSLGPERLPPGCALLSASSPGGRLRCGAASKSPLAREGPKTVLYSPSIHTDIDMCV